MDNIYIIYIIYISIFMHTFFAVDSNAIKKTFT